MTLQSALAELTRRATPPPSPHKRPPAANAKRKAARAARKKNR